MGEPACNLEGLGLFQGVFGSPALLWFRQDLRLQDNPALRAAIAHGGPVVPVYILDDTADAEWPMGAAARWWLHGSLAALDASLRKRGSRLIFAQGDPRRILQELVSITGARALFCNRRYEPSLARADVHIETILSALEVQVLTFNGALLNEPDAITNKQGGPFQVFTAYWRHCLSLAVTAPVTFNGRLPAPRRWPPSLKLATLRLRTGKQLGAEFSNVWQPGESAARKRLSEFLSRHIDDYVTSRDRPDRAGTSLLSASLHFGEISPRQIWAAVRSRSKASGVFPPSKGARVYLGEIGWREFAYHLLHHFPDTPTSPLRAQFSKFRWAHDPDGLRLRAWQHGLTGYPLVDAGMRQLRQIGWMHNRVRMVTASFLVKHLRLPWTLGASWFWKMLVDADLANNTLGWQWTAGCGADAAPYFRVFAPVLQGRKFDPDGTYVRRWLPELAELPTKYIHAPWEAPAPVLSQAGIMLGKTYPRPLVDHAKARAEALAAFKELRAMRVN